MDSIGGERMSVSIVWKPVNNDHFDFESFGSYSDFEKLSLPRVFNKNDISFLEGYSAGVGTSELANEIIELILKHGEIRVWGEF